MVSLDNGLLAYISYSLVILIFKLYKFFFWSDKNIQNTMNNKQEIPDLFPTLNFFSPRIPKVSDTLDVTNQAEAKKGTRDQTVGMRFFDFLAGPTWTTFSGLNLTGAWFVMQPYFAGTTWLYAADMFKKYKR